MDNDLNKMTQSSNSMSCSEFETMLDAFLDEELPSLEQKRFERHFTGCQNCGELLEDYTEIVRTARSLAELPVPTEVSRRLRARLEHELGCGLLKKEPPKLYVVK